MRKTIPLLLLSLLLLGSCSLNKQFHERKYRPGFFIDRPGKKESQTNSFHEAGSFAKTEIVKPDSALTDTAKEKSTELPVNFKTEAKNNTGQCREKPIAESKEKTIIPEPVPILKKAQGKISELEEEQRINIAFGLAVAAFLLFFGGIALGLLLSVAIGIIIAWALALIASLWGFVMSRKIKRMHLQGDPYPGKWKVIFAYVIGIIGIVLGSIGLLIGGLILALVLGTR